MVGRDGIARRLPLQPDGSLPPSSASPWTSLAPGGAPLQRRAARPGPDRHPGAGVAQHRVQRRHPGAAGAGLLVPTGGGRRRRHRVRPHLGDPPGRRRGAGRLPGAGGRPHLVGRQRRGRAQQGRPGRRRRPGQLGQRPAAGGRVRRRAAQHGGDRRAPGRPAGRDGRRRRPDRADARSLALLAALPELSRTPRCCSPPTVS